MENKAFVELVAYCQRQGVLSSDSSVIGELAEITGLHCYEIAEMLEGQKMTVLEKINREQNRRNQFLNVSREDLQRIDTAIQEMIYFGWKKEKAEEIIIDKFLACRPLVY